MFKHRKGDFKQMRKNIERMIGLTLCMGMLAGCAQTPESSLVRQKGNKALDSYKEADDKDVNMAGNASSADQTTASESTGTSDTAASTDVHPDNASAARTTIRDLINAPETYKSQVTDDTSKLVVNTDAAVEIPDVEKISAISVTPAAVTQDLLDGITDAFFSNAKIYTADSYYVQTKDEIKKKIDELKEDVANGNLDPNNWGTDDNGNLVYDIYDDIDYWESQYESAPETRNLRNTCEINKRGTRNQHLLCAAIQTHLKCIGKFIHLYHCATNCYISQHCQVADNRLSKGNRTKCNQCWKCQFICHADTLQILIIDDVILGRGADRATDPIAVGFQIIKCRVHRFLTFRITA